MRILVVDDDPLAGEMTVAILEGLEYEALLAESGPEAAEILSEDQLFDLILSDLNMPLVSGIDLFRELRSQGVKIPFILLTGDDPEGPLKEEPSLDGCLMKDFSLDETLPALLEEVLLRYQNA
jgi:CheY-like chemotaxis protein